MRYVAYLMPHYHSIIADLAYEDLQTRRVCMSRPVCERIGVKSFLHCFGFVLTWHLADAAIRVEPWILLVLAATNA